MARRRYLLSLPERWVRALAAILGGTAHETASLVLPRFARRSRLYEATAKNLLRVLVEGVGAVEGASTREEGAAPARELAKRKTVGNIVEVGSIAAFGFSPLWLLAGASDILRGSRVYLNTLVDELKAAGVLAPDAKATSVDDLLRALEGGTGTTARLIDIPPLELEALRRSLAELRSHAEALPSPAELEAVYDALQRTAEREHRPLLEVSTGVGLAFLNSAKKVGREHVVASYAEDWRAVRHEGFGAYARRVAGPYRRAVSEHFDAERPTYTERVLGKLGRDA
jgi:hypothetical protein